MIPRMERWWRHLSPLGVEKVQTGSFLQGAAPYGLLGLGIEPISVPNILFNSGHVSNSFSMCFPQNSSVARFTFGDKRSSDQKETLFIIDQTHPTYYLRIKEFYVGNSLVKTEFQALFDTGTSFTYLVDSVYKSLTSNYHLQTQDSPLAVDESNFPFELCYETSNSQSINQGPDLWYFPATAFKDSRNSRGIWEDINSFAIQFNYCYYGAAQAVKHQDIWQDQNHILLLKTTPDSKEDFVLATFQQSYMWHSYDLKIEV